MSIEEEYVQPIPTAKIFVSLGKLSGVSGRIHYISSHINSRLRFASVSNALLERILFK